MRIFAVILMAFVTLLLVAVAPVSAADITWEGNDGGSWHVGENWDRNRPPQPGDRAIINNGTRCEIDNTADAVCETIEIDDSSTVRMLSSSVLTLGEDGQEHTSYIEDGGKLEIGYGGPATLEISGEHEIVGDVGTVVLLNAGSQIVEESDEDDVLTIEHSCGDTMDITCSLVLKGRGEIEETLVNNSYVVAQTDDAHLELTTRDKSGDGFWIAENNGTLYVNCNITGAATWMSVDKNDGGQILISGSGCVNSTGDVYISGAGVGLSLGAQSRFCTTGNLEFKSSQVGEGSTTTGIDVGSSNAVAIFGVSECYAGGGC